MKTFAYIRVSTEKNQTTDNQRKAITDFWGNVDEWYSDDGVSGKTNALDRPVFKTMMDKLEAGDQICCVSIDRLGRNALDILNTIEAFRVKGVKLRCMALDGIDLTSATGKILTMMLALLAEMERDACVLRTKAGLARTKAAGTVLGRPLRIPAHDLAEMITYKTKGISLDKLSEMYGYDRSTINQTINKWRDNLPAYKERWDRQVEQATIKAMSLVGA